MDVFFPECLSIEDPAKKWWWWQKCVRPGGRWRGLPLVVLVREATLQAACVAGSVPFMSSDSHATGFLTFHFWGAFWTMGSPLTNPMWNCPRTEVPFW